MQSAVNPKSWFSFACWKDRQKLSKPHTNSALTKQQETLLSPYAPCWESRQHFPHAVKTPTILSSPFLHLLRCLDSRCLGSSSPPCQRPVLSGTTAHETTAAVHARGLFLAFTSRSCRSPVQTRWLMRSSASSYSMQPRVPLTFQQKHSTLLLSVPPRQENTPVSSLCFPNAVRERRCTRVHVGVLHLKRALQHTGNKARDLTLGSNPTIL